MKSDTPCFTDDNQPAADDVPDDIGELRSLCPPPLRAYELDEQRELATVQTEDVRWRDFGVRS